MRTQSESQMQRNATAREEFAEYLCGWWPASYKSLLPVTCDGKSLLQAKRQIEVMMEAEAEQYAQEQGSPWQKFGREPTLVDWSEVNGVERFSLGVNASRPVGMPAPVKINPGADAWKHPLVVEAQQRAHRTAEWVACIEAEKLRMQMEDASHEYVRASNSGASKDEVAAAKSRYDKLVEADEAARAKFNRLRSDPNKGLRIVREALSDAEVQAEAELIGKHNSAE